MKTSTAGSVALIGALACLAGLGNSYRTRRGLESALEETRGNRSKNTTELKLRLEEERKGADAAERDLEKIVLPTDRPAAGAGMLEGATLGSAEQLAATGKYKEALEQYLELYRARRSGTTNAPTYNGVYSGIWNLGRTIGYPQAIEALEAIRDNRVPALTADPGNDQLIGELVLLDQYLDDHAAVLAIYNRLPPDHPLRSRLREATFPGLVQAGRYREALEVMPLSKLVAGISGPELPEFLAQLPNRFLAARTRDQFITTTAFGIVALTATSKGDEAKLLTEKLLAFDGSASTQELIRSVLAAAPTALESR